MTIYPYASRKTLFSAAERSFLGVLEQCLDSQYQVHGKVRLADILKVKASTASERQSALNRISRKHVDFVVTRASDASIIGVIELDDKSHNEPERQNRDAFVDTALGAAALPIVHIKAKARYSLPDVKKALANFPNITRDVSNPVR